ncbi:hypothetical protein FUAX_42880 (plasmid) [Fulvitalea axinellae]|uniref:Uncharacterized protein n=2 Tax=Fulvitalea axinellae TaxID=1182444 RepID=A0AAU9CI97_9BACT|nr:hypothetical protein FUAX_42880 [Fulvitalea axinellae]
MNLRLNKAAFVWAQEMISSKRMIKGGLDWDEIRDDEDGHKNMFKRDGALESSMWFLAVDPTKDPLTPEAYDLPIGDFTHVYTGALGAIKDFANDNELFEIQNAAIKLLEQSGIRDYSK